MGTTITHGHVFLRDCRAGTLHTMSAVPGTESIDDGGHGPAAVGSPLAGMRLTELLDEVQDRHPPGARSRR
jgi:hypothetical protein